MAECLLSKESNKAKLRCAHVIGRTNTAALQFIDEPNTQDTLANVVILTKPLETAPDAYSWSLVPLGNGQFRVLFFLQTATTMSRLLRGQ